MNKYDENTMIADIKAGFAGAAMNKISAVGRLIDSYLAWDRLTDTAKSLAGLDLSDDEIQRVISEIKRWELDSFSHTPSGSQADWDFEYECWIVKAPFRNFKAGDKITLKQGGDRQVGGGITPSLWVKVG